MNRDLPAISHLTEDHANTIQACICLSYELLYGKHKAIASEDERVSEERILDLVISMYGQNIFDDN